MENHVQSPTANTLVFYPEKQTLYLTNNAQVMQDNHRVEGNQLIYFLASKKLVSEFNADKRTTVIIPPRASPQQALNDTNRSFVDP